jgi:pimeloyl-ACP methyl ester carboxylesterase
MPVAAVNGTTIYYEDKGTGEPVLLLPGLGTGLQYYAPIEPLLRRTMRTISVDPRGIGQSGPETRFSVESWVDDFAALLDHLGIGSAHVVGSSMGGAMALAMADQHPKKVASLLLFGAMSEIDRYIEINMRLRMRMVTKLGMGEDIRDFILLFTSSHEFLDSPGAEKQMATAFENIIRQTPQHYAAICESLLRWGRRLPEQKGEPLFTERLHSLTQPTLVVCGDTDFWIPPKFSRIIADKIPGARYLVMEGCGHIPVRETPPDACKVIADFVAEVAKKRG